MELLVSVRSADEVGAALAGGADIIDAKEPALGSLGPVSADTLAQIQARVPDHRPLSIALGDLREQDEVLSSVASLELRSRSAPVYLKLGFAGVGSPDRIAILLRLAVQVAARHPGRPRIVAVAYADADRAGTVFPVHLARLGSQAGVDGVLLDTYLKDGQNLLRWLEPSTLDWWVSEVRRRGRLSALAGGLESSDLDRIHQAAPDVVGVRGAACEGGREGVVSPSLVRQLRRALDRSASVSAIGRFP